MHKEILTTEQNGLLPLLKEFKKEFYMVGGTAVALQIGHRESIYFDLFKKGEYSINRINKKIAWHAKVDKVRFQDEDEYTLVINSVQFTFYNYPYLINAGVKFESYINMPDLLTLAAMKSFALGKRAKWKDYVDLYFVLKQFSLNDVIKKQPRFSGISLTKNY